MKPSKDETIQRIEQLGGQYDPESTFGLMDQLLACESIAESTPVNPEDWDGETILNLRRRNEENGSVNGDVNGGCKRRVNFTLNASKLRAISQLNDFTIHVTPLEIESCLQEIFSEYPTIDGWWLYVGQHWTQRQIHWVLKEVLKLQVSGRITKHPAACFTFLIRHRNKRKNKL